MLSTFVALETSNSQEKSTGFEEFMFFFFQIKINKSHNNADHTDLKWLDLNTFTMQNNHPHINAK